MLQGQCVTDKSLIAPKVIPPFSLTTAFRLRICVVVYHIELCYVQQ